MAIGAAGLARADGATAAREVVGGAALARANAATPATEAQR